MLLQHFRDCSVSSTAHGRYLSEIIKGITDLFSNINLLFLLKCDSGNFCSAASGSALMHIQTFIFRPTEIPGTVLGNKTKKGVWTHPLCLFVDSKKCLSLGVGLALTPAWISVCSWNNDKII